MGTKIDIENGTVTIDGVEYVRKGSVEAPAGDRVLLYLDNGFIFAGRFDGDVFRDAVNVRRWSNGGIGGLSRGAKTADATLDRHRDLVPRMDRVLFTVPIQEGWENA